MSRYAEFSDSAGRHYVEGEMPEQVKYRHKLSSFGEPRRISVYDPSDPTPRHANEQGGIVEHPKGEPGLVGYADIYREKAGEHFGTLVDQHGNREPLLSKAHTNIGYVTVEPKHRGGGISKQLINYIDKTTPADAQVNFGEIAHMGMAKIAMKMEAENPHRIHEKGLWYYKDKLKKEGQ